MIGRTNSSSMSNTTAALDFTVVDGLTEPTNPKEKMIWIATDEEITSWTFSATEPAAQQGLVWFQIGKSSQVAFSVTKDNPIMVYPIRAYQYINNSWTEKITKTYQDGSWVKWSSITYWFKSGEGPVGTWNNYAAGQSVVNINTNKIQLLDEHDPASDRRVTSKTKINLTNFNTLYFNADKDGSTSAWFGIANTLTPNTADVTFVKEVIPNSQDKTVWELDVSEVSGEYYIAIWAHGSGSVFVYDIYGT